MPFIEKNENKRGIYNDVYQSGIRVYNYLKKNPNLNKITDSNIINDLKKLGKVNEKFRSQEYSGNKLNVITEYFRINQLEDISVDNFKEWLNYDGYELKLENITGKCEIARFNDIIKVQPMEDKNLDKIICLSYWSIYDDDTIRNSLPTNMCGINEKDINGCVIATQAQAQATSQHHSDGTIIGIGLGVGILFLFVILYFTRNIKNKRGNSKNKRGNNQSNVDPIDRRMVRSTVTPGRTAPKPKTVMDEHNRELAGMVKEKGWEGAINQAAKGMTYAEFRARYG